MNDFETAYIADIRKALTERTDLEPRERYILEQEVILIEGRTIELTGAQTADERLERLRNHYP